VNQTAKNAGPVFAVLIVGGWAAVHLYSLFAHNLSAPLWQTFGLIALQCWLYTGMFIVAHDTMHGSLFKSDKTNALIGTAIMFIYAGFNWRKMREAHHAHHDNSGTQDDPDFNADNPHSFWPWYMKFFWQYFGVRQVAILFGFTIAYILLGAPYLNIGTYLTHRHKDTFLDYHNARTNDFPFWLSLLTCFHFGYHHEHHLFPHEPWWRLPARKQALQETAQKRAAP